MGAKKYVNEVIKEGKRVRWPKKEKFFPVLISVIIICAFAALILSVEDWASGTLIGQLKDLFSGLGGGTSDATSAAVRIFNSIHF